MTEQSLALVAEPDADFPKGRKSRPSFVRLPNDGSTSVLYMSTHG